MFVDCVNEIVVDVSFKILKGDVVGVLTPVAGVVLVVAIYVAVLEEDDVVGEPLFTDDDCGSVAAVDVSFDNVNGEVVDVTEVSAIVFVGLVIPAFYTTRRCEE